MSKEDPFAGLDDFEGSPKKDDKKAERKSRKLATKELSESLDDLDLEKKPANPFVLFGALTLLILAFGFSLKPVSFTTTGEGVYAVQVDIELIGDEFLQSECRPTGENEELKDVTVTLSAVEKKGAKSISDFSLTQPLPFADAEQVGTFCFFEVFFDGVRPTDGTIFDVKVQLPDRTFKETRQLDPQMKIGPITFTVK